MAVNDAYVMTDPVEALAEAWASMDGKLELFRRGRGAGRKDRTGHFEGYMVEAQEMIVRLEKRGFKVVPT